MPSKVPPDYEGREQTYLKHRVLQDYLVAWAMKRGSTARFKKVRLWYVDCFAGPWQAQDEGLTDTSVCIGLDALEEAAETWKQKGAEVTLSAIFVEPNDQAFVRLSAYLTARGGRVETFPLHCEFGNAVQEINKRIGSDAAFLFVDPTGWKGAGMRYIAPLAQVRGRDVLINVMFNHINRFKDDPRAFLRGQLREFFGLEDSDVPPGLNEDALFELYRRQLRDQCKVRYAADLAIPHPKKDRTWFRLVMGGHHPATVELFRTVEKRVCGAEAAGVRDEAQRRGDQQESLGLDLHQDDQSYQRLHAAGVSAAPNDLLRQLRRASPQRYSDLWPEILADHHLTKGDLNAVVWDMNKAGTVHIRDSTKGQRSPKDEQLISLAPVSTSA